jgi:ankyrin repeat protein
MKYIKLFENFEDYNPHDLMIMFPDERLELFLEEIEKPISKQNLNLVRDLINLGTINTQDARGRTPLHWAASRGQVEIVRMLIDAKANLNLQSITGDTPLHWATLYGQEKIVKMLIDAGADLNVQDEEGYTPLHYIKDIRISVGVKIARMLIEGGADETILDNDGFRWDEICGWDRDYIESDYDYD